MEIKQKFWSGKRVVVTGHTGFKGGWLSLWLRKMGAEVYGVALPPVTTPNIFDSADIASDLHHYECDIRNVAEIQKLFGSVNPHAVFHLAAQSIVRESYSDPIYTFATNVLGTATVIQASLESDSPRAVVCVTSDKCYENREWYWGYRENDRLGGHDPYSASKACAELVASAYRGSFTGRTSLKSSKVYIASARAGNVIGGGDFSQDRLIPDFFHSVRNAKALTIRNPGSVRPWQHVLESLNGYLTLAQALFTDGEKFAQAWNFGPESRDSRPVRWIIEWLLKRYPLKVEISENSTANSFKESRILRLDSAKARHNLSWTPLWDIERALVETCTWYDSYAAGKDMKAVTLGQIDDYQIEARRKYD